MTEKKTSRRTALALLLTVVAATTACSSSDDGTPDDPELALASLCSRIINDRLPEATDASGSRDQVIRTLQQGNMPRSRPLLEATDVTRAMKDDREHALEALEDAVSAAEATDGVEGLDAWLESWRPGVDVLDTELTAIDSGDHDRMQEVLLDGEGKERLIGEDFPDTGSAGLADRDCGHVFTLSFPENTPENLALLGRAASTCTEIINRRHLDDYGDAKDLIFRNVVAKAATRQDMDDLSDEVVAAARQLAEEKRRTSDDFAALDGWGEIVPLLEANAEIAEARADAVAARSTARIQASFDRERNGENPTYEAPAMFRELDLDDRDCGLLFR